MATLTTEQRAARDVLRLAVARDKLAHLRAGLISQMFALGYDDRARVERSVDRAIASWLEVAHNGRR